MTTFITKRAGWALVFATVIATLAFGEVAAAKGPGTGKTLQPARPTWDTGWFHAEIYIKGLEALGYEVKRPKSLQNPAFFQAVAQGSLDYWANTTVPLHNTYINKVSDKIVQVGYVAKRVVLQGYLVDKKSAEKYEIKNLNDFKRGEVKKVFDSDGDGKAELVACPPGWGCELVIGHHLEAYGLREHIDPIKASYSSSMADAYGRFKDGEPILFYTWTPNWTLGLLKPGKDVVWIEVPHLAPTESQKPYSQEMEVADVDGCVRNPCRMGFPAGDIRVTANKEFLANNPAAKRFFEVAGVPPKDMFEQNAKMYRGEDSEEDIIRHAEQWIENNRETFDSWISEAKEAAD